MDGFYMSNTFIILKLAAYDACFSAGLLAGLESCHHNDCDAVNYASSNPAGQQALCAAGFTFCSIFCVRAMSLKVGLIQLFNGVVGDKWTN